MVDYGTTAYRDGMNSARPPTFAEVTASIRSKLIEFRSHIHNKNKPRSGFFDFKPPPFTLEEITFLKALVNDAYHLEEICQPCKENNHDECWKKRAKYQKPDSIMVYCICEEHK